MNELSRVLKNPYKALGWAVSNIPVLGKAIPDEIYLKIKYRSVFGEKLDLDNPKTFNAKMQWLKLYNRNPEYTTMVDKYAVKKYIAEKIGSEYIIPTLGVWNSFDEIDFDALPNQFVLKCTHDSGGLVVCRDKSSLDMSAAKKKIETSLSNNFYYRGREWPYKNVPHRIIAEQYMAEDLRDYKLFCFDGIPRMTLVCSERFTKDGLKEDFYDEAWNHVDVQRPAHGNAAFPIQRPKQYELMKKLAAKLSEKMPFARIDFYEINDKVYFGEITFFPASGFEGFTPQEWDLNLGEWIKLPSGGYRLNSDSYSIIISHFHYNNRDAKALVDYKFFCFDGNPKFLYVSSGMENHETARLSFYDLQLNEMPFGRSDYKRINEKMERPKKFEEMISIARTLSKNIPFLRVDLYCVDNQIYFSELTFYPNAGFINFEPKEWDEKLGEMLDIATKKYL